MQPYMQHLVSNPFFTKFTSAFHRRRARKGAWKKASAVDPVLHMSSTLYAFIGANWI